MSLLEWLGGVRKNLYDETLEKCRRLEEEVSQKEGEIADLKAENSKLKSLYSEVVQERDSLKEKTGSGSKEFTILRDQYTRLEIRHNEALKRSRDMERKTDLLETENSRLKGLYDEALGDMSLWRRRWDPVTQFSLV